MGWSPPKFRVTPNCMAFWDYKKCWFFCLRICLLRRNKGHWFQHFSTRLHPAVPGSTWVPLLTRNIFRIKLTLCCKWFTSSKVSSWYRKHLPRLLVSWMPNIRGFHFKESHQNCKIALTRIQIIPKLSNIFKYIQIYFPNLSNVSSLHLLWATADSLWRPLVTNSAKFQSSEGLGFSSPPKPGISWHSPSERETKKKVRRLSFWVNVVKSSVPSYLLSLFISHSWKLLRAGKLTASALSFWCF